MCSPFEARRIEVLNLLESSSMSRRHGSLQHSLSTSAYLSSIVKPCADIGFDIEAVASDEVTNVLWEQGETRASIQMLEDLIGLRTQSKLTLNVNRPELLAKLVRTLLPDLLKMLTIQGVSYFRSSSQESR
jgi:ataxia telangiectasia mutated family protein